MYQVADLLYMRSYLVLPSATTIEARHLQAAKVPSPILSILFGIVIKVRDEQFLKALFPILVTR